MDRYILLELTIRGIYLLTFIPRSHGGINILPALPFKFSIPIPLHNDLPPPQSLRLHDDCFARHQVESVITPFQIRIVIAFDIQNDRFSWFIGVECDLLGRDGEEEIAGGEVNVFYRLRPIGGGTDDL